MRLWTWQGRGHSLVVGGVDHARSQYADSQPGIGEAYARLAEMVGSEQLIWCYADRSEHLCVDGDTHVRWELLVPDDAILAFVDTYVWNKLLGIRCGLPERARLEHLRRATKCSSTTQEQARRRLEHEFWDAVPGSWDSLLVGGREESIAGVQVLVRHPVPREWVVRPPLDARGHPVAAQDGCGGAGPQRPIND
jgi:hypothetical protein